MYVFVYCITIFVDCEIVCNNIVHEDCSEVKCAKVIHDIFDKLCGLCRARNGLRQYRSV